MLARWHRAWVEAGRDDGSSLGDGRGERYTSEQKRAAVDHYLWHGRCAARTIRALGYPCKVLLARWIDELEPGRRRVRRAPVDARTRRRAVVEYASGSRTSRRVGEELGVSADVVRNRKYKMLPGDDKERAMGDDAEEGRTPKAREGRHRDDGGRSLEDMRRERDEIRSQLTRMRAERDELEIIRRTKELLGKRGGRRPGQPGQQ